MDSRNICGPVPPQPFLWRSELELRAMARDLPSSLTGAEVSWDLCEQASPFFGLFLILERLALPSPPWRLCALQLELFAGLVPCLLRTGGWASRSLCHTKGGAPGKHGDSWCLHTANSRRNFCDPVLFLRCAESLAKQNCSEGTNIFLVSWGLSVPRHSFFGGCIFCRRNWHHSSCFRGSKRIEKPREEFNLQQDWTS